MLIVYFNSIASIFGIGKFTASLILVELGDINRFNTIKELTTYHLFFLIKSISYSFFDWHYFIY
ncbi:MAG: IS110 family transposase [Bacilli bacterium]|nr:IS110 family transposase [Bacilli bacterium]